MPEQGYESMSFRWNFKKAVEAAGVVLRMARGKRMRYIRLLKLLYIADRVSLQETGRPITGDRVVAMEHGPVLSRLYDCIKGEYPDQVEWDRFFVTEDPFDIRMKRTPGIGELCRYEIEVLQRITKDRVLDDDWKVVEETHGFEEWTDPGNTSVVIPYQEVLKAVGRGDQADRLLAEARADEALDALIEGTAE